MFFANTPVTFFYYVYKLRRDRENIEKTEHLSKALRYSRKT